MSQGRGLVIGVIGDFSGAGGASGGGRRFLDIDRDDFDDVFRRLSPRVRPGLPFCQEIELTSWEHLHPDELALRVPALSKLMDARDEVGNPSLMRRIIEDSGVDVEAVAGAAQQSPEEARASAPAAKMSEGDLLDAILDGKPPEGPVEVVSPSADPEFDRVIAEIVGASADRTDYAQQDRWRQAIDREIAERMRAILHSRPFQRLEASWRSLRSLVMALETGEDLRVRVLDLSRGALAADAAGGRSPLLDRLVVEDAGGMPGGEPFGLLVADYALGAGDDDRSILGALAAVAGRAQAPCVTGLSPSFFPEGDLDWDGLEGLCQGLGGAAGSDHLGLIGPRLLLRLPYGPETEPIDRFEFDEQPAEGSGDYLWGNAAYAVAFVAGEACASLGHVAAVAKFAQLEDLPVHVARHGVDVASVGPTDRLVSDSEIERLADLGLIPLVGFRGRDTAFVARFQSLTGDGLFPD